MLENSSELIQLFSGKVGLIFFAILGLLIGSFLNVVILRYNTGKGLGGRSICFSCGKTLKSINLIPVLSYIFQRGRCSSCKSKVSAQYITVELLTSILFVIAFIHSINLLNSYPDMGIFTWGMKLTVDLLIMSVLIFMIVYDIRHKIIPDIAVVILGILTICSQVILGAFTWKIFFAGIILAVPFYLIWLLSSGRWMGLGDAKLVISFGWLLGLSAGFTAVIFGFWLGAVVSIFIIILQRLSLIDKFRSLHRKLRLPDLNMKSEVPFAPFLITGLLIVYYLGYNLFVFVL